MYRVLIEDKGTEGFGVVVDMEVRAVSLLTDRPPTEEERKEEGVEGGVVGLVHRGWHSNFETLGVLMMAARQIGNGLENMFEGGPVLPDEESER